MDQYLNPDTMLTNEQELIDQWLALGASPPADATFGGRLADQWKLTGCAKVGAPFVASALLARLVDRQASPFASDSPHPAEIADRFLSEKCDGARGLSEDEVKSLKVLHGVTPDSTVGTESGQARIVTER